MNARDLANELNLSSVKELTEEIVGRKVSWNSTLSDKEIKRIREYFAPKKPERKVTLEKPVKTLEKKPEAAAEKKTEPTESGKEMPEKNAGTPAPSKKGPSIVIRNENRAGAKTLSRDVPPPQGKIKPITQPGTRIIGDLKKTVEPEKKEKSPLVSSVSIEKKIPVNEEPEAPVESPVKEEVKNPEEVKKTPEPKKTETDNEIKKTSGITVVGHIDVAKPSRVSFVDHRNPNDRTKDHGKRPFDPNRKPGSFQKPGSGTFQNRPGGFVNAKNSGPKAGTGKPGFSGSAEPMGASKTDVRGKKSNAKDNRRDAYDRSGKQQENFKNLAKGQQKKKEETVEEKIRMITLPEIVTISDLATRMKLKASDLIKKLFLQGKMMTANSELSYEEAENIALEYDILCEKEVQVDVIEELLKESDEEEKDLAKRPPVVCVMGHVDHGKTSLLDAIRKTNVTSREAGGITQHIGAYMVNCKGEPITFLDTPGHEAFTAMRLRGAQATDVAVLVVAADDGVMPQTVEAINHAKAANVEVIVAVNKIDKPAANIDHVKQQLAEYELIPEDWGGQTVYVPVSAKTGEGIDKLLEMILLVTEVKELKANPNREIRGIVIEAKLDKGRGPVATVLVQKGTLKPGDFISCGSCYGRVRAMLNADGIQLKKATPSMPCEILGLNGVPNAGEVAIGHKNEKSARTYAETFIAEEKKKMLAETKRKLTMDSLFDQIKAGDIKELPIIVKADVQGSVEAVKNSLEKLSNDEVVVKVIHGGAGNINESDITLASASNALVIGFNIKEDAQAKQLAEAEKVDVRLYRVIYQAIDDVEAAMKGMLKPLYEEKITGHAEIRQTFKASGIGMIAGSYVLDGTLERGTNARITRDKEVIFDGPIASLKRFKDDVKEVKEGFECGIVFEKFNDIAEGDQVEAYKMVEVPRT